MTVITNMRSFLAEILSDFWWVVMFLGCCNLRVYREDLFIRTQIHDTEPRIFCGNPPTYVFQAIFVPKCSMYTVDGKEKCEQQPTGAAMMSSSRWLTRASSKGGQSAYIAFRVLSFEIRTLVCYSLFFSIRLCEDLSYIAHFSDRYRCECYSWRWCPLLLLSISKRTITLTLKSYICGERVFFL